MKKEEIQLSKEFKTQEKKAIIAIAFFVITYLLFLATSIFLSFLCIAFGIFIIASKPMFFSILLGIGLGSLGILILIFLLNFLSKTHKIDRSNLVEITKVQEPEFFKMIEEIIHEVGTSFPKKVYISYEVNASVFYDSSFWSMFLPVKKNLHIGLGLVNTVSKEELKAILSHEFGHFSQRTMKVGSYVYYANQIIHNMLFENESYEKIVQKWAEVSGYFSIFVLIASKINKGIQWIFRKLYGVVNKSYLGLSREMEFHADEIASSVTGYLPLKKSLLRMSLAENSLIYIYNFYNGKISENINIKSENIYNDQTSVIQFLSEENNLKMINNLPEISLDELKKFDKSKLVIKDQWASHPSLEERIKRLEQTAYIKDNNAVGMANSIFSDITQLQKQFTEKIFEEFIFKEEAYTLTSNKFIEEYKLEFYKNSFSKIFNCYYDNKNPLHFDLNQSHSIIEEVDILDLFSKDKVDLVYTSIALQNDLEVLKNIENKSIYLKTFDYDGNRYSRKDAKSLIQKLRIELENINEKIKRNDINIYCCFLRFENDQKKSNELKYLYSEFFSFDKEFESKFDIYIKLTEKLEFVSVTTPYEQITANFNSLKPAEDALKEEIGKLLLDNWLASDITHEITENLEKYISKSWDYFGTTIYNEENLKLLFTAINNYAYLLHRRYFLIKKELLNYQEKLIEQNAKKN